jgi:hypothetical protein
MPATQEEVMKIKGSRRLIRRLGLALAVAAVFAPSAQATPLDVPPRGLDLVQTRLYADDVHAPVVTNAVNESHYGYAPINTSAQPEVVSPVATDSGGIDWGNPTIGAGALFVLLGLGGLLVAVHHARKGRLAAV